MRVLKLYLAQLAILSSCCEAYKILVVFPIPTKSHANLGDGVVRNLINDGHQVTYIAPYAYKPESPNVRWIDIVETENAFPKKSTDISALLKREFKLDHVAFMNIFEAISRTTLESVNVQRLIQDPNEQFDVVIAEWTYSEPYIGFATVFNCPFIWVSSLEFHWSIMQLIDQPLNPSYTADIFSSELPPFTFLQRAKELYVQLRVMYLKYMFYDKLDKQAYEKSLVPAIVKRGRQPPSYEEVKYNASLILGNAHPSTAAPVPLPQSAIPVGGYFIAEDVKPLSEDLKKIMDNSKNGVVYFSMGSTLKSKHMPKELKDGILKVFSELKQTVIWKFEEDLPNKPKNVHILKWAPQQSILAHPNTILFITHGGLLSTTETIHFGVPVIGVPVFVDQFINVERAVHRGFALKVELSLNMANELKLAIEELTSNPKYYQKAKELSMIYHDRPLTPGKELVHWVKHVIKTRGAPHLRSPALDVAFYQKLYLDLLAVILLALFVLVRFVRYAFSKFSLKLSNVSSSKKKH